MGNFRTPKSYNLCCLEGGNQWFWGAPMFIFGTTHTGRCASLGRPHWSVVVSPQSVAHHRIWGIYTSEIKICHAVSSNGAGWLPMNVASWNLQQKSNMKSFPMSVGCTLHHCAPPPWFRFWLNCPIACWLGWPLASSKCGTSSRWPHCNVTGVMGIGLGGNGRWVAELFRLANGSELFYVGDPFFEVSIILFAAPPPLPDPWQKPKPEPHLLQPLHDFVNGVWWQLDLLWKAETPDDLGNFGWGWFWFRLNDAQYLSIIQPIRI